MRVWGRVMKKVDKICFIVLNILIIVTFFPWIYKCHYVSDSYNIMNVGYEYYSINNSLNDGRIFMFIILNLVSIINLDFKIFVKITLIIALIVSNISVYLLKTTISKQDQNWKEDCILWIACYTIIYNFTYIDNLSYVECIVMSLGVLLSVISVDIVRKQNKYWILKILLLNIISILCYQMMPIFFLVLVLAIELIYNKNLKEAIKKFIISCIIIGIVIIIDYLFITYIHNFYSGFDSKIILDREETLKLSTISIKIILQNITLIIINFQELILSCDYAFFRYCFIIFFFAFSFVFVYILNKNNLKKYIIRFLILIIGVYGISNSFFVFSTYGFNCSRLKNGFGALLGLFALFLISLIEENHKELKKLLNIFIIIYCITNILNYSYLIFCELKVNKLESIYVDKIYSYIKEYEELNNTQVTKICLNEDSSKLVWFNEIHRNFADLYNSCACSWSAIGTINYYTNRNFILTQEESFILDYDKDYEILQDILYIKVHKFD